MNPQTPARLTGSASMSFQNPVYVVSCASVVGKKEGEGPLGSKFDLVCEEPMFGEATGLSTFTTINQIRNPMKTDMIFKVKFLVSFVFFMSHSSFQQMTQFTVSYNLFILSLDQCRSQFSTGKTSAELSVLGHGHLPGFF